MAVDWEAIHKEYTETEQTYAQLGAKYGVHRTTICRRATKCGWQDERAQFRSKMLTAQAEAAGAKAAKGIDTCITVAQKLLNRILRRVEEDDTPISTQEYRQLTSAVKDIREILTSPLDVEKRKADIEVVKRQLGEGKDNTLHIVIDGNGSEQFTK